MEGSSLRVLGAAFATVPGANPHSAAFMAMASALRADMDFVTVKPPNLAYQGRLGEARLFRVPVQGTPAEQRAGFAIIEIQFLDEHRPVDTLANAGNQHAFRLARSQQLQPVVKPLLPAGYHDDAVGMLDGACRRLRQGQNEMLQSGN